MNLSFARSTLNLLLAVATACALSGCDKRPTGSSENTPATTTTASSTASAPIAGIVPQAEDAAGSGVPGPGAGETAVGGMAAQQDAGGARVSAGKMPAPTGGDGAASASSSSAASASK